MPATSDPRAQQIIRDRFAREAEVLEMLGRSSDQIPTLYAYFAEGEDLFLVQEWVEGKNLQQKVFEEGMLSEAAVKQILVDLLPVLAYIHDRGIIHRDIKPANIILRAADDRPVLIDFGTVKEVVVSDPSHHDTGTTIVVGSPGFMAPEQAAGRPVFASDIYSLGLTAIYLLTGQHSLDVLHAIAGQAPARQPLPPISPQFRAVLAKATALHAQDRYQTAGEMLQAIKYGAGVNASPVTAQQRSMVNVPIARSQQRPVMPAPPVRRPVPLAQQQPSSSGERWVALAGLAALLVVGLGAGALAWRAFAGDEPQQDASPSPENSAATVVDLSREASEAEQQPNASPSAPIVAQQPDVSPPVASGAEPQPNVSPSSAASPSASPSPEVAVASLRETDWSEVFAADPKLQIETIDGQRYVSVVEADALTGIPLVDNIVYIDLDRDGVEEAAIPLFSGGTAGNIGFLIYRQAQPRPALVAWQGGYKQNLSIEQGRLVASDALYTGWEPNCCPSGVRYRTYELQGDQLRVVAERSEGNVEMQAETVRHFYELINNRDLETAYTFLSDDFKRAWPYDKWVAGYATTVRTDAEVTEDPSAPNTVRIALTATDRGDDGEEIVRRFTGTWKLEWAPERPGWILTEPRIQAAP
jgi:serine/threonine-protein kinase